MPGSLQAHALYATRDWFEIRVGPSPPRLPAGDQLTRWKALSVRLCSRILAGYLRLTVIWEDLEKRSRGVADSVSEIPIPDHSETLRGAASCRSN